MTYSLRDVAKDIIKGDLKITPEELSRKRLSVCESCPEYGKNRNQTGMVNSQRCSLCGCFMPVKVKLVRATCPANKW